MKSKRILTMSYKQIAALCAALVLLVTGGVWFVNSPLFKGSVPDVAAPEYNIRGVIMQTGDGWVLMKVTDGWIMNSSDLVTVPVDTGTLACEVGMNIAFYYDGLVMESFPAQIEAPPEVMFEESVLPTFGELYDFENYLFHSAHEEYYVDIVENGIGHTETVKDDYYFPFPEKGDEFGVFMKELLFLAKPLKNVGYHSYFFNNPTTKVTITTSVDIAASMTFDIVIEESGWLRFGDDMFFIGEDNAARLIEYVRTNGVKSDNSVDETAMTGCGLIIGFPDDIDSGLYEGKTPIKFGEGNGTILILNQKERIGRFKLCEVEYTDGEFYAGETVFLLSYGLPDGYYIEYSTDIPEGVPMEAIIAENFSGVISWNGENGEISLIPVEIFKNQSDDLAGLYDEKEVDDFLSEFSLALAEGTELILVEGEYERTNSIAVKYPDGDVVDIRCIDSYYHYFDISPDGTKISYTLLDHGGGPLYVYDVLTRTLTHITEFDRPQENDVSKRAIWLNDEILLVTVGLNQGSVTKGGDIHYYNIISGENHEIIKAINGRWLWNEFTNMEIVGDYLEFGVSAAFNEAIDFFNYTDRIPLSQVYDLISGNQTIEYKATG